MKAWLLGYQKAKDRAKELYSSIGRLQCPAFNNEHIAFTSVGFNHLLRKGRIPRTKNEQKRRFVLLQHVEQIMKNPKATILYERRETKTIVNRHGEKILIQSVADFWTFVERIDGCNIKVVIRQLHPAGQKHFLSIMGDRVEISRCAKNSSYKTKKPRT